MIEISSDLKIEHAKLISRFDTIIEFCDLPTSVSVCDIIYNINKDGNSVYKAFDIILSYKNGEIADYCNGDNHLESLLLNQSLIDVLFDEPKPDIFCKEAIKLIRKYLEVFIEK